MQPAQTHLASKLDDYRLRYQFRYYARLIRRQPQMSYYHKQRLHIATQFHQSEPLQGALADYFFACWHELFDEGLLVLSSFGTQLPHYTYQAFERYINQGYHLPWISSLATRWSVLVSPSMNVAEHKLYVGQDDAKWLSSQVTEELLWAKQAQDDVQIESIQAAYLQHCLACQDRMGFMKTWFALAKSGWTFDENWLQCRQKLEAISDDVQA